MNSFKESPSRRTCFRQRFEKLQQEKYGGTEKLANLELDTEQIQFLQQINDMKQRGVRGGG